MEFQASLVVCLLVLLWPHVDSTELTIEVRERDVQCFHEVIEKDTKYSLDYQVISGGNYDIDVQLLGPDGEELYNVHKMKYDNFERTATKTGEHKFCFSNTFSSLSQKKVYFDFWVGNEVPLTEDIGAHQTALTQLETSAEKIHESLKVIYNYQVHHRLREAIGRNTGNNLNHRVQYWSMGEAVLFVLVALGQVIILRRFFTEKRTSI